jgi:hypothetical protein
MHMQCSKCRYGHGGKGDKNVQKKQPVPALFGGTYFQVMTFKQSLMIKNCSVFLFTIRATYPL